MFEKSELRDLLIIRGVSLPVPASKLAFASALKNADESWMDGDWRMTAAPHARSDTLAKNVRLLATNGVLNLELLGNAITQWNKWVEAQVSSHNLDTVTPTQLALQVQSPEPRAARVSARSECAHAHAHRNGRAPELGAQFTRSPGHSRAVITYGFLPAILLHCIRHPLQVAHDAENRTRGGETQREGVRE
jgi:hypothetical protein